MTGGRIARIKKGSHYALPLEADLIPGRVRVNRQGVGLLQPDQPGIPALRIPQDAMGTVMHGDRALVRRDALPRPGRQIAPTEKTGRVVRVLARQRTQIAPFLFLLLAMPVDEHKRKIAERRRRRKGGNAWDSWDAAHGPRGLPLD